MDEATIFNGVWLLVEPQDLMCCHVLICIFCDEYVMTRAGLVGLTRRGQRASVNLRFPRSPKDCFAPLECERNIFSSSLFDFALRMHNPCLNMPRTTTPPCVIWVGVRDTCIPVGGIVGLRRTWLEHYPSARGSPCRYLLSRPPPPPLIDFISSRL